MERGAEFDVTRTWRYWLWRSWAPGPRVTFVMLNPSDADAIDDDPTIRKCIGFAKHWGYPGIDVVNLFALKSTDPKALRTARDPVGPANDDYIGAVLPNAGLIVAAWGAFKWDRMGGRIYEVLGERRVKALRLTKDGRPWHPLYVPYAAQLLDYRP